MLKDEIKKMRLEKKLTQEQLSKKMGVSTKTIYRWETGKTDPKFYQYIKLLLILGKNDDNGDSNE